MKSRTYDKSHLQKAAPRHFEPGYKALAYSRDAAIVRVLYIGHDESAKYVAAINSKGDIFSQTNFNRYVLRHCDFCTIWFLFW